jgi:hypothetical protein
MSMTLITYVECNYAECNYAECHYAECHYDKYHDANLAWLGVND